MGVDHRNPRLLYINSIWKPATDKRQKEIQILKSVRRESVVNISRRNAVSLKFSHQAVEVYVGIPCPISVR